MQNAAFYSPATRTLRPTTTVADAMAAFVADRVSAFPIVGDDGRVTGLLTADRMLRLLLPRAVASGALADLAFVSDSLAHLRERLAHHAADPVGPHAEPLPGPIHPDTPLAEVLLLLDRGADDLPVTERDTGRLVGTVSASGMLALIAGGR